MPDILQNGSPGCDANTSANKDGYLVVEYIFGGSTVGAINAEFWHGLAVLESYFVHPIGIDVIVELGLGGSGSESVTKVPSKVSDLSNVDGDVGVERTRGDREGMPLLAGDGGYVEEEPLTSFVLHGGFAELNLHGIWYLF